MYYLGVLEINEYSAETVAELVNRYAARMYGGGLNKLVRYDKEKREPRCV